MPPRPAFRPRTETHPAKAHLAALLLAGAFAAATVHAPAALAATPCWKTLLNDWYDGRIDQSYPVHCYHDALKHLPTDVQTYSSAHDDILRALQSAIAKQKKTNKNVNENTLLPPQTGGSRGGGSTKTSPSGQPGRDGSGGLAGTVSSDNPSSIPTPLLVLGGLALLLVAAGGAGLVAKRIQARRNSS
jgi:hypothetical protein